MGNNRQRKKKNHFGRVLFWFIIIELTLIGAGLAVVILLNTEQKEDPLLQQELQIEYYTEEPESEPTKFVPRPDIDEQILTINDWSRPGTKIKSLDYIVIHYLGNPKTTAQENHDYFESLKDLQNVSMSANYVVGLNGEVIHCVPDDEIAYASNRANKYSISIENCHPDETGKLNNATYDSLVRLTAYLAEKYELGRDQIIRHYDVTGKDCPKYFVEHEEAWTAFLDDVEHYQKACKEAVLEERERTRVVETEYTVLSDFLKENNAEAEEQEEGM